MSLPRRSVVVCDSHGQGISLRGHAALRENTRRYTCTDAATARSLMPTASDAAVEAYARHAVVAPRETVHVPTPCSRDASSPARQLARRIKRKPTWFSLLGCPSAGQRAHARRCLHQLLVSGPRLPCTRPSPSVPTRGRPLPFALIVLYSRTRALPMCSPHALPCASLPGQCSGEVQAKHLAPSLSITCVSSACTALFFRPRLPQLLVQ